MQSQQQDSSIAKTMAPSQSVIRGILFGAAALTGLSLLYFFFFRRKTVPLLEDKPNEPVSTPAQVVVADVEEESDEEEEEEEEEDAESKERSLDKQRAAELKEQYDNAVRIAHKFIKAEEHVKAAEKLSEAIKLASQVSSVSSKDLIALYNNRSAMNEKAKNFEESLRDIKTLLTMDPMHVKARLRRARVNEALNVPFPALVDLFFCTFRDPSLQEDHSHRRKLETLVKQAATTRAQEMIAAMRNISSREERVMPSHAFLRNALEAYMSLPAWREAYPSSSETQLLEAFANAQSGEDSVAQLRAGLDLIRYHSVHNEHKQAFSVLGQLVAPLQAAQPQDEEALSTASDDLRTAIAETYEMLGFEQHMLYDLPNALQFYDKALAAAPANSGMTCFVQLKRAAILTEQCENTAAHEIYAQLLASEKTEDRAWTLFHRSSMYVSRDAQGRTPQNAESALADCLRDLQQALDETEPLLATSESAKLAHFSALLKCVHVRTHIKAQLGLQASEEDAAANKASLEAAARLYPHHDSLLIMQASQLTEQNECDAAIALVDAHCHRADNTLDQASALVLKASICSGKAFLLMASATSQLELAEAERIFRDEVCQYFEKALSADPQSLEVLCQYAQTKSMLGDTAGCVQLLRQALPLIKARDEAFDIATLLVQSEAQVAAMQELMSSQ